MRRRFPVVNLLLMLAVLMLPAFHLQGQKGGYRPAPVYRPPPPPPRRPPPPPANNNRSYNNRTPANNNNRYGSSGGYSGGGVRTQASSQRIQQRQQAQSGIQRRQTVGQSPQTRTLQRKSTDPVNGKRFTVISQSGRRVNYIVPPMPLAQRNAARAKLALIRGNAATRLARRSQLAATGGGSKRPPDEGNGSNGGGGSGGGKNLRAANDNTLRSFNGKAVSQLSRSARELDPADKGGQLTLAGRALQKHRSEGRKGSGAFPDVKGGPAEINAQGQRIVDEILNNPASSSSIRRDGRFGNVTDVKSPDGRRLVYNSDGKLIGFLEPEKIGK